MENKNFCLRWNHHQEHLMSSLTQLLAKKELVDVSIWCNKNGLSRTFDAHKVSIFQKPWFSEKNLGFLDSFSGLFQVFR